MFKRSYACALGCMLALVILARPAAASDLLDASWRGEDLLFHFSDSVSYTIDLAESDSSQLVIRFHSLTLQPPVSVEGANMRGPAGRRAVLTQAAPNEARLTLTGRGRLGYASLWRPYSHTLVVHTFDWEKIDYASEQYYKALLALEQGLDPQAIELLKLAHATGETRAASVLGVYYARHGNPSLARQYLDKPLDADDHAALAALAGRSGDSTGAQTNREQFERATAQRDTAWRAGGTIDQSRTSPGGVWNEGSSRERAERKDRMEKWILLGGGGLLLLIVIGVIISFSRRSSKSGKKTIQAPARQESVTAEPVRREAPPVVRATEPAPPPPVAIETPVAAGQTVPEEPVDVEPVVAESVDAEQVTAEQVATEPAITEEIPGAIVAGSMEATPPAGPATVEAPVEPPSKPGRPVQTQAAELRRRIEAMREAATAQAPPQPVQVPPTTNKQTITEARRLRLSRDSVELRRRLDEASDRQ